ncbi:MAG TPA: GAP family protein [Actinomycetota bacterium]|nr:GAP family protein [Actinomycetota bacterium]
MSDAFGQMLPFALVIALSPIPIVAVIAMLFSKRAIANGIAFLVGWIVGVAGGLALLTVVAEAGDLGSGEAPSTTAVVLRFLLGALLLVGAVKKWRGRPRPGDDVAMPGWMARIDGIGPVRAFGLAVLLGGVNPKNLLMNVAAAAVLASEELAGADQALAIVLYTVVASASVALAVGYRVFAGDRGTATLERMRGWLAANEATVMSVILLLLGVKLVGDAITGL